jgi:hypothetical protein
MSVSAHEAAGALGRREQKRVQASHRMAEHTSLALHQEVAARLRTDPAILEMARGRVEGWLRTGGAHRWYAERWAELLRGSVDALCDIMTSGSEEALALRQVSPFAGALDARTRWRIWRAVRSAETA